MPPPPAAGNTGNWLLAVHLSQLVILFSGMGLLGPLIIYLIKKDEDPVVGAHAKEALNFQLSVLIYGVISLILVIVLVGLLLLAILVVLAIVFPIIGAVRASNGELWRYPLTIRFIS